MLGCQSLIAELEQSIQALASDECPVLLGELERLKAMAWGKIVGSQASPPQSKASVLLTMAEAAARLSIPQSRAYELARQRKLPTVRIGKYVRVSPKALDEYQAGLPKT